MPAPVSSETVGESTPPQAPWADKFRAGAAEGSKAGATHAAADGPTKVTYDQDELEEMLYDQVPFGGVIFEDPEDEMRHLRRRGDVLAQGLLSAKEDIADMQAAGVALQEAYEALQDQYRNSVGDVAYFRALAEARAEEVAHAALKAAPATADRDECLPPEDRRAPGSALSSAPGSALSSARAAGDGAASPPAGSGSPPLGGASPPCWGTPCWGTPGAHPRRLSEAVRSGGLRFPGFSASPEPAQAALAGPPAPPVLPEPEPEERDPREQLRQAALEAAREDAARRRRIRELEEARSCDPHLVHAGHTPPRLHAQALDFGDSPASLEREPPPAAQTPPRRTPLRFGSPSPTHSSCSSVHTSHTGYTVASSSQSLSHATGTPKFQAGTTVRRALFSPPGPATRKWGPGSVPRRCPGLGAPARRVQADSAGSRPSEGTSPAPQPGTRSPGPQQRRWPEAPHHHTPPATDCTVLARSAGWLAAGLVRRTTCTVAAGTGTAAAARAPRFSDLVNLWEGKRSANTTPTPGAHGPDRAAGAPPSPGANNVAPGTTVLTAASPARAATRHAFGTSPTSPAPSGMVATITKRLEGSPGHPPSPLPDWGLGGLAVSARLSDSRPRAVR